MENDNQNIISGFGYPSEETKAAVDRLWEKIRFLGNSVSELRTKYDDSIEYSKHLEHQISNQNDEIDKFQARTTILDQLFEGSDMSEEELIKSLGSYQEQNSEFEKIRIDLEFAAKEIIRNNADLHEKNEVNIKLKDDIALLKSELQSSKTSSITVDEVRNEFSAEIDKLNSKISSDEYTINELRKRKNDIESELNDLKLEKESIPEVQDINSQELETLSMKVESFEANVQVAKNEILIKDKIISDSHKAFEELQQELSNSEAKIIEIKENLAEARNYEIFNATLNEKIRSLEEEFQIKNTEYLMKDSKVNELLRTNKVQEDLVNDLKTTVDNTENQLIILRREVAEYNKDLMNSDSLMERLRLISEAKAKIETENFELNNQNQELQELLKTRYEQIDILERQINNMLELDKLEVEERTEITSKIDQLVGHLEKNFSEYVSSINNK